MWNIWGVAKHYFREVHTRIQFVAVGWMLEAMITQIKLHHAEAERILTEYFKKDNQWNKLPNLEIQIETSLMQKKISLIKMLREFYAVIREVNYKENPTTINKPGLAETKEFIEKWLEQNEI